MNARDAMTKDEAVRVLGELIRRFDATIPTPFDRRGESTMRIEHFVDLSFQAKQALRALTAPAGVPDGFAVNKASIDALVAGPFMYHHKMDERQECEAKGFDRCREMTLQSIEVFFAARDAMLAAAPPSDAPGEARCVHGCVAAVATCGCSFPSPAEQGAREADPLTCVRCRVGFNDAGRPLYMPLENRDGFAVCEMCDGSYGGFDHLSNVRARSLAAGRVGVAEARSVIDRVVTDALTRTDGTGMFRVSYVDPDAVKNEVAKRQIFSGGDAIGERLGELVEEYEYRGDGDYTPNENERALLLDFAMGLPEDDILMGLFTKPAAPRAGLTDGQIADAVAVLRELTGESKIDMPHQRADYLARMARRIFALAGPLVAGEDMQAKATQAFALDVQKRLLECDEAMPRRTGGRRLLIDAYNAIGELLSLVYADTAKAGES